jgi:hypothetical protein
MLARITEPGMRRLADAAPTHVRSVRTRFLDPLDRADLDALARSFAAIHRALHPS